MLNFIERFTLALLLAIVNCRNELFFDDDVLPTHQLRLTLTLPNYQSVPLRLGISLDVHANTTTIPFDSKEENRLAYLYHWMYTNTTTIPFDMKEENMSVRQLDVF